MHSSVSSVDLELDNEPGPGTRFLLQITRIRVATLQSRSNSLTFPGIFQVFLSEALIKPPEVYRKAYVYSWVNNEALLAVHVVCQLHLTVLRLSLFCDYRNCGSTAQANHNFPDFSPTNVNFPMGGHPVEICELRAYDPSTAGNQESTGCKQNTEH